MTALSSRAGRAAVGEHRWFARDFARLLRYLNLLAEGIAEGFEMARASKRRHPFADW